MNIALLVVFSILFIVIIVAIAKNEVMDRMYDDVNADCEKSNSNDIALEKVDSNL